MKTVTENFMNVWYDNNQKEWSEGRTDNVGASELFSCEKRVHYRKTDKENSKPMSGHMLRGDILENYYLAEVIKARFGDKASHLGSEQQTFRKGNVTATPDGILTDVPRIEIEEFFGLELDKDYRDYIVEFKTHHPMADKSLGQYSPEHEMQTRVQMFVCDKPAAILVYCEAASLDITTYYFERNIVTESNMLERADKILKGEDLFEEGLISGECKYCEYVERCGVDTTESDTSNNGCIEKESFDELIREYEEVNKAVKRQKALKKLILAELSSERIQSHGYVFSLGYTKPRRMLNTKKLTDMLIKKGATEEEIETCKVTTAKNMKINKVRVK